MIIRLLLFVVCLISIIILIPLGIYGFFIDHNKSPYLFGIDQSYDRLAGVILAPILNKYWVAKGGYQFGDGHFTMSYGLGYNQKLGTLTSNNYWFFQNSSWWVNFLDKLEPDHCKTAYEDRA